MVKYIHKYTKEPAQPAVKREESYTPCCDDCEHKDTEWGDDYEIDGYHCDKCRPEFNKGRASSCPEFDDKYRKKRCDYCTSYGPLFCGGGACLNKQVPDIKEVSNKEWNRAKTCPHFDYEDRKTIMFRKEPWRYR
jgi:hypothetical protein